MVSVFRLGQRLREKPLGGNWKVSLVVEEEAFFQMLLKEEFGAWSPLRFPTGRRSHRVFEAPKPGELYLVVLDLDVKAPFETLDVELLREMTRELKGLSLRSFSGEGAHLIVPVKMDREYGDFKIELLRSLRGMLGADSSVYRGGQMYYVPPLRRREFLEVAYDLSDPLGGGELLDYLKGAVPTFRRLTR